MHQAIVQEYVESYAESTGYVFVRSGGELIFTVELSFVATNECL